MLAFQKFYINCRTLINFGVEIEVGIGVGVGDLGVGIEVRVGVGIGVEGVCGSFSWNISPGHSRGA